jgi:hypothetical protein
MNDFENWIYNEGPAPASAVLTVAEALGPKASPRPRVRGRAAVKAALLKKFDALIDRVFDEGGEAGEDAGEESSAVGGGAAAAEKNDAAEPAPPPVSAPVPASIKYAGTGELEDRPAWVWQEKGKLPFIAEEARSAASGKGTVKTMPVPVWRENKLRDTLPLGDTRIHKMLPDLPYARNAVGGSVVSFPGLTAQEYVSLRADLATRPGEVGETLRRYDVPSEASWRALEAHWREQLTARAELRAEFEAVVDRYTSWLRGW